MTLMFGFYNLLLQKLDKLSQGRHHMANQALAASSAGLIESILCPFERIQVLLQDRANHSRLRNTLHTALVLRRFGVKEYFRGWTSIAARNSLGNVIYFTFTGRGGVSVQKSVPSGLFYGVLVGGILGVLFYPFDLVRIRTQKFMGGRFYGPFSTFIYVWNKHALAVHGMGCFLNGLRGMLSWGMVGTAYAFIGSRIFQ
ncbi:solute carrier family 25 member 51-like [Octopus sinensis]|nr:solute carrier family 25 member 51-like [Octopus sinensis]